MDSQSARRGPMTATAPATTSQPANLTKTHPPPLTCASSPMTASWLFAAPPPAAAPAATRGCSVSTVAQRSYVSFWSHVMSAFSCRPKISGLGTMG